MQRFTNLDKAEVQSANINEIISDVIALLAVVHFCMQSKLDLWEPTIMAGIYGWLMGYRLLGRYLAVRGRLPRMQRPVRRPVPRRRKPSERACRQESWSWCEYSRSRKRRRPRAGSSRAAGHVSSESPPRGEVGGECAEDASGCHVPGQ